MTAHVSRIVDAQQHALRQLALNSEVVGVGHGDFQVRIKPMNCALRSQRRGSCARRIRQVSVLKLNLIGVRRKVGLRENQVALCTIVKRSESAANHHLLPSQRRPSETEARHEKIRRVIKSSRRPCRHGERGRAGSVRHTAHLVRRNSVARADQTVERIAGPRND
jgi:hypothetical protein